MSTPGPGLAVERTVLAWTRTWLTVAACALLLLRLTSAAPMRTAAALGVGAVAVLACTVVGRRRAVRLRALAADATGRIVPAVRAAAVTAATATLLGLAAAVLVATH